MSQDSLRSQGSGPSHHPSPLEGRKSRMRGRIRPQRAHHPASRPGSCPASAVLPAQPRRGHPGAVRGAERQPAGAALPHDRHGAAGLRLGHPELPKRDSQRQPGAGPRGCPGERRPGAGREALSAPSRGGTPQHSGHAPRPPPRPDTEEECRRCSWLCPSVLSEPVDGACGHREAGVPWPASPGSGSQL